MTHEAVDHSKKWSLIAAFAFGVTFVVAVMSIALFRPNPTAFEYTVFRIVIALAAAGVGAVLPGFLDVQFKNWLRAGGALAIFVVVYFFAPVVPTPVDPVVDEPKVDAKAPADSWLALVDQQKYREAYDAMAKGFQEKYPYTQFDELLARERGALGKLIDRTFVSSTPFVSPPGAPKGAYRQYVYRSNFAGETKPIYESVWLHAQGGQWGVSGFYIATKTESGQFVPYEAPSKRAP
jgi:hypothetical protein